MKKLTCLILTLALTALLLGGCSSLFANESSDNKGGGSSSGSIKITDSYTYEDPADLEFDERYVIYCGEDNTNVISMADSGLKSKYIIVYGKDGKAVGHYGLDIYDTAENAQATVDEYNAYGWSLRVADEDPAVVLDILLGDELDATIVSYIGFGDMKDDSVQSYVDCMKDSWGGTLQ